MVVIMPMSGVPMDVSGCDSNVPFKVSERDEKWWMNESDEKDECSGNRSV